MKKPLILFILFFSFILGYKQSLTEYQSMDIEDYLSSHSDSELNIFIASLILAKDINSNVSFPAYDEMVKGISKSIVREIGDSQDPSFHIAVINTVLFRDLGLGFDTNDYFGQKIKNHLI